MFAPSSILGQTWCLNFHKTPNLKNKSLQISKLSWHFQTLSFIPTYNVWLKLTVMCTLTQHWSSVWYPRAASPSPSISGPYRGTSQRSAETQKLKNKWNFCRYSKITKKQYNNLSKNNKQIFSLKIIKLQFRKCTFI